MSRRGQHVFEVGDLQVGATGARIDYEGNVALGVFADQRPGDRQRRVGAMAHPEHDLHLAVVLVEKRTQIVVEAGLGPMQWLQYRDCWSLGGRDDRPPGKAQRGHRAAEDICPHYEKDERQGE